MACTDSIYLHWEKQQKKKEDAWHPTCIGHAQLAFDMFVHPNNNNNNNNKN